MNRIILVSLVLAFSISSINAGGLMDVEPYTNSMAPNCTAKDGCYKNGVYLELDNELMWQDASYRDNDDAAYVTEDSNCKAGNQSYAADYCQSLVYNGYSDWRLPSSDEMMHVSKKHNVFVDNRGADFWTSTSATRGRYFTVYTVDGYRHARQPIQSNYIRCVRCNADTTIKR